MLTEYVALDIETTGLDPKRNKIIEIAAIHVKDGEIAGRYQTLINPGWKLEERITELTGLTEEDLKTAPPISEKIGEFLEFVGGCVIMGHSILFDYSFLKRAAVNQGMGKKKNSGQDKGMNDTSLIFLERAEAVDTLFIARKYLPELPSRGLDALCMHYGIRHHAHRAMEDAQATHLLYQKLCEEFYTEETKGDFAPKELHYQVKRESPVTRAQKERLQRMLALHDIEPDYDVERLTKSEASRIIDRIILQYGK